MVLVFSSYHVGHIASDVSVLIDDGNLSDLDIALSEFIKVRHHVFVHILRRQTVLFTQVYDQYCMTVNCKATLKVFWLYKIVPAG